LLIFSTMDGAVPTPYNLPSPEPTSIFEDEQESSQEDDMYERVDVIDRERHKSFVSHQERASEIQRKFTSTFSSGLLPIPRKNDEDAPDLPAGADAVKIEVTDEPAPIPPPARPIHLIWQDIRYSVEVNDTESKSKCPCRTPKMERTILNGVTGEARPGQLTVILGPSGCGKTTLLNILSGRIKLRKSAGGGGLIYVNGVKRNKRFKRHTAFVLQEDLFFSSLTVEQTLNLTGQLRIPGDDENEKLQRVQNMISLLKLEKCKHGRFGNAVRRGLSGGEKKRLNVANELLVDPALIFLDEPTSGLDAVLADDLLQVLSLLAKCGRTVITTLHQPSSQIYNMVDNLYLMAEGGRVAYFGPAKDAVAYFSNLGFRCPRYYNPADFVLELVQNNSDLHEHYTPTTLLEVTNLTSDKSDQTLTVADAHPVGSRSGKHHQHVVVKSDVGPLEPIPDSGEKWPISWSRQVWLLGVRSFRQHMDIAIWNIFIFLLIAAIGSIVWWNRGYTFAAIGDREGLMFFCLLQWFIFPMFGEVNSLIPEIPIITKERREGMYRLSAYATGKTLGEILLDVISPVLFTCVIYWTTNLNNAVYRFFTEIVLVLITYLNGQAIGFGIGAAVGKVELASPILLIIMFVAMLVSGFYASMSAIPYFFRLLQYINPIRYLFDAFIINEFAGTTVFRNPSTNATITGDEIVNAYKPIIWDGSWACVWYNVLVIIGITLVFRIFGFWLLRRRTSTTF
jgi:ABC-type multidrug transport system ATPase subunit